MLRFSLVAAVAVLALSAATAASADVTSFNPATHPPSPFAGCTNGAPQNGTKYENTEPEPFVDVDPTSKDRPTGPDAVGVQQQDRFSTGGANGLGTSTSGDGGSSWNQLVVGQLPRFDFCAGGAPPDDYERASDPWVSYGPDGDAFQISLSFNDTRNLANAVLVSRSTSDGNSWGPVTALKRDTDPNVFNDKESITADYTRPQNVYAVWDRLIFPKEKSGGHSFEHAAAFRGPIWFSRTKNDGASWTTKQLYDPGQRDQTIGNQIVVMPDGDLVDGFTLIRNDNKGGRKGFSIAVIRSTNEGDSWSRPIDVARFGSVGVTVPDSTFDEDSDPELVRTADIIAELASDERPGTDNVYMVWQDARFNGFNRDQIAFSKSTDGGLTWSTPVRINKDPSTQAWNPIVRVDDEGNIGVLYDDFRNDDPATYAVETDVWFLRSTDGGSTWSEERVSPSSFDVRVAPFARGYFLGDYHGLAAYNDRFLGYTTITYDGLVDSLAVSGNTTDTTNRTDVFAARIQPPAGASAAAFRASRAGARQPASAYPTRKVKPRVRSRRIKRRHR
jgi:hypothetical protein